MTHSSLALLVQHVAPVGGPSGPSTGGDPLLISATLYLAVAAIALIAGPALTGVAATVWSRRLRDLTVGTAGIVGGLAVLHEPSAVAEVFSGPATHALVVALHLAVVCVWLAGVLHLAVVGVASGAQVTRRAIARFTPLAVAASTVIAASGAVLMVGDRIGLQALLHSAFGALLIVKIVAVVLAAMVGVGHRLTPSLRERRTLLRTEAGVLAATLGVGSAPLGTPVAGTNIMWPDWPARPTGTASGHGPPATRSMRADGTVSSGIGPVRGVSTPGGVTGISLTPRLLDGSVLGAVARLRLPPGT